MILSSVIDNTKGEHTVEPYRFKVLALHSNEPKEPAKETAQPLAPVINNDELTEQTNSDLELSEPNPPTTQEANTVESTFIEELLKRTDDLSGNIVKLQMQIENQENEFKIRLANETTRAKEAYSFKRVSTSSSIASGLVEQRIPINPYSSIAVLAPFKSDSIYSRSIAVKLPPKKAISAFFASLPKLS